MRWLAILLISLAAVAPAIADDPAPSQQQAKFEVRYMTMMIEHHAMAVEMANQCQAKTLPHDTLLESFCATIQTEQSAELQQLQAWLRDWYGISAEMPTMKHGRMQQLERLNNLSGAEFEIEFLKRMIRHHWMAVVQSSKCTERAAHDALVTFCTDVVETQTAEITQMRTWLCDWYQLCNYGPKAGEIGTGDDDDDDPACKDVNPRGHGMGRGRK